jgi:hypothetical protein
MKRSNFAVAGIDAAKQLHWWVALWAAQRWA